MLSPKTYQHFTNNDELNATIHNAYTKVKIFCVGFLLYCTHVNVMLSDKELFQLKVMFCLGTFCSPLSDAKKDICCSS